MKVPRWAKVGQNRNGGNQRCSGCSHLEQSLLLVDVVSGGRGRPIEDGCCIRRGISWLESTLCWRIRVPGGDTAFSGVPDISVNVVQFSSVEHLWESRHRLSRHWRVRWVQIFYYMVHVFSVVSKVWHSNAFLVLGSLNKAQNMRFMLPSSTHQLDVIPLIFEEDTPNRRIQNLNDFLRPYKKTVLNLYNVPIMTILHYRWAMVWGVFAEFPTSRDASSTRFKFL